MGNVARLTALDAYRRMLVEEWTALVDVALKTGLFIADGLIDHPRPARHVPGRRKGAMRVVTIRAFHRPLVDAMLEGHRKLSAYGGVTSVTEVALLGGFEQIARCGRMMNRVAICADDVSQRMFTSPDICARDRLRVATQARVQDFLRREFREGVGNSIFPTARCYVTGSRAVATLTANSWSGRRAGSNALVMRISEERNGDIGVACAAYLTSNVLLSVNRAC